MNTLAAAIAATLAEALEHDASTLVLGETVGRSGGIAGTTRGLLDRFGPERVIDLPVADRGTIGLAVGLALGGRRPIVELSSTGRLLAVLEALAEAASVARAGEFAVPVVVRVPVGTEAGDQVDRAVADVLAGIAGLAVVSPSTPELAAALIRSACRARGPVVVLEPRALYGDRGPVGEGHWPLGAARLVREGDHVTLAAWGAGVHAAIDAAEALAAEGITADVVDLVSLAPLDRGLLGDRVRHTGRLVAVDPGDEGFARRLLRLATDEAFDFLEAPPATAAAGADDIARTARAAVHY